MAMASRTGAVRKVAWREFEGRARRATLALESMHLPAKTNPNLPRRESLHAARRSYPCSRLRTKSRRRQEQKREARVNAKDPFIQTPLALLELPGFPRNLRELYGRMKFHAGKRGECYATYATLAREIGLKSRRQIIRLIHGLKALRLIERVRRGRYFTTYKVLVPDVTWMSRQMRQECPISDVTRMSHRKEVSSSSEDLKKEDRGFQKASSIVGRRKSANANAKPNSKPATATARPTPTANPNAKANPNANANANAKTNFNFPTDDDDEHARRRPPQPETPPPQNPEEEFLRRLASMHGMDRYEAADVLGTVMHELNGVPFGDFLKYDAVRTTAKVNNPGGYFRALCRKFVKQVGQRAGDKLAADIAALPPRRSKYGRCSKCGSKGELPGGENCDCALGREVASLKRQMAERQMAKSETAGEKVKSAG